MEWIKLHDFPPNKKEFENPNDNYNEA